MANRRMFSMDIVDSDAFLDLPLTTQALYFHLGMRAIDKGVIRNMISTLRSIGCTSEDVLKLKTNGFLQSYEDGYKITHWYENNGIGETAKKRNNYEYRQWRIAVIKRDGGACTICGNSKELEVHHVKSFSGYPELRTNLMNGITLCHRCHRSLHKKERVNDRS